MGLEIVEQVLWDWLVCRVNDNKIQRRLLGVTDTKLGFKKALELAVSMEVAENAPALKNCVGAGAGISPLQSQTDLNRVDIPVACYQCGRPGHK